jgi:ferredoxin
VRRDATAARVFAHALVDEARHALDEAGGGERRLRVALAPEAAALLAARDLGGGSLIVPKLRGEHVTVAVAALNPLSISSACTACGACLRTCPERALRPAPQRPVVIATRCSSCGECVEICPTDAITLRNERGG